MGHYISDNEGKTNHPMSAKSLLILILGLGLLASFTIKTNWSGPWEMMNKQIDGSDASKNISPKTVKDSVVNIATAAIHQEANPTIDSQSIRIIGVGDMMLGSNFPDSRNMPPNDGKYLLTPVKDIISSADVAFGNLEGVLLTADGPPKKCSNPAICYAFKMPDHYVEHFKTAGFDILSVANNHVNDFGKAGTKNTMQVLKKAGIEYAGLTECPFTIFEMKGNKYGFAAFAPNQGTISFNNFANAKKIIRHLDSICDIVIVSFHGGAEGASRRNITRMDELFIGENRGNPYAFARMAIDAGADVIFGHGPHVTRAVDLYKDRFIAYSMGNFATYGSFNLRGPSGLAPIISIEVDKNGKFISGFIHSTKQTGKGGPVLDPANGALKEIIELTKTDIPECRLQIETNGYIYKQ